MFYVENRGGGKQMTIVVKKVPKCFRGIVKFIFGVGQLRKNTNVGFVIQSANGHTVNKQN